MRRTKIVATLGPASDDPKRLREMINAGLDVARLNFSHGNEAELRTRAKLIRNTARECGRDIGIMGDLQGPKIRVRRFLDSSVILNDGDAFFLDSGLGEMEGNKAGVGVAYERLHEDVQQGDILLLNDGQMMLKVDRVDGSRVHTTVVQGGVLSDHKGINRQGGGLSAPALTDKDRSDIRIAADLQLDFLAVSFVRAADDVEEARKLLRAAGGHGLIVAKIERTEALECIDSIIDAADVIMVARGDLGVEMGYAELTGMQKQIIRRTRHHNKVVITATQMMESMINNPIPTRAEVSDVANAVMDGTDAVMLSAETAVGKYPVAVISAMSDVCKGAEKHSLARGRTSHRLDDQFQTVDEAIAMAVMYTANHLAVKAIIALTESGATTLWMSRIRSDIPIYAFTPHETTSRRVCLYRGVYPVAFRIEHTDPRQLTEDIFSTLLQYKLVEEGDLVIFTKGDLSGVSGSTNGMKILSVYKPG
ncbi:MAG: pyruvate kinase [Gammaproteobacteria bacterium]|nr:pyruvate kinase [Gammaproteobacteria bacterium]MDH4315662.1 pyruvate kinase [Gammaproteobacteria bacterium]MDH5213590.1 pyruvate kinase [Gammaproteobacteria bacterium]MDH5499677.1 pyruvate kinase [Gammaproteobacteria bacterium]